MTSELFIKMVIGEWTRQNNFFKQQLDSLTDEQASKEIAPGKNTGLYLVGHLVAVSDSMLPLLGFGEKLFPHHYSTFVEKPDKSGLEQAPLSVLKQHFEAVNAKLTGHILATSTADWFARHMAVSEEDFAKEPHRNKLNILINRSSHMSYHLGQLVLLK